MIDLRLGDYREVLRDVTCDAVITDCPYSERIHSGHDYAMRPERGLDYERQSLSYGFWNEADVIGFCEFWNSRCTGWVCAMTSHDLAPAWEASLENAGRYVFAPIPCVIKGMTCRLGGDGPSSWTVWLIVSRTRSAPYSKWGTLPGAYIATREAGSHIGGKPRSLMAEIIRDYSRPGDLIADPCAGFGTTLYAALAEGRRAIGAEIDPDTHAKAMTRTSPRRTDTLTVDAFP